MPTRRTFVKGLALSGTAASLGLLHRPAAAAPGPRATPGVLEGTEFDLRIGETRVELHRPRRAPRSPINGSLPGPDCCAGAKATR